MKRRPIAVVAVLLMAVTTACSAEPTSTPLPTPTPSRSATVPSTLDSQLITAAWKNDVPTAKRLIEAGANVNAVDSTVQSAFLIAASEGYLDLLNLTLAHGADVRSLDSYHGTALIRAAERGHAAVVGRLIQAGVAVNHVNNLGWTALHEAVILGKGTPQYVDTVRLLVAGGADRNKPAVNDGTTPVQAAKERGQRPVSAVLDAHATAGDLLDAATAGDTDKAAAALAAGAKIESRDDHQRTALLPHRSTTGWTWPGCWSSSARIPTRRTTGRTPPGSSPASPAASRCWRRCCRRTRTSRCGTGSAVRR